MNTYTGELKGFKSYSGKTKAGKEWTSLGIRVHDTSDQWATHPVEFSTMYGKLMDEISVVPIGSMIEVEFKLRSSVGKDDRYFTNANLEGFNVISAASPAEGMKPTEAEDNDSDLPF